MSLGLPVSKTSSASCTIADSTQPPETEPHRAPPRATANEEPTGRGAERRVPTTVATTTSSPSSRQRRMSSSSSLMCRMVLGLGAPHTRSGVVERHLRPVHVVAVASPAVVVGLVEVGLVVLLVHAQLSLARALARRQRPGQEADLEIGVGPGADRRPCCDRERHLVAA